MFSEPVSPESLHVGQYLVEHCCQSGVDPSTGRTCARCGGTTRQRRGTHDPRSGTDYEPPTLADVLLAIVRATPNDSDLGATVRKLIGGRHG